MGKEAENEDIPTWGRDEMNLIELPFGPITATSEKTLEVVHAVYDPYEKEFVERHTLITGSDAFGLPRPIDEQVLIGLKALTHESGYKSRKIHFSAYRLCKIIGWPPDGRSYKRLDESLDRIAGTMFKFKNAWYDKGEKEWKTKRFHIIEDVELCPRKKLDRNRKENGKAAQKLCYFHSNDVIWKSFKDGFIRKLDMEMFRKVSKGKKSEVATRLYRVLAKKLYNKRTVTLKLENLAIGILGLSSSYNSPSQMERPVRRAAERLIELGFLQAVRFEGRGREASVIFHKATKRAAPRSVHKSGKTATSDLSEEPRLLDQWWSRQSEKDLDFWECQALSSKFGGSMERDIIERQRSKYADYASSPATKTLCASLLHFANKRTRKRIVHIVAVVGQVDQHNDRFESVYRDSYVSQLVFANP